MYLKQFPIKETIYHKPFINIVDKILLSKAEKKDKDINYLENQFNNLVYKLYELTYEELLVIEPEFSEKMSREEYESLEVG